MSGRPGPWSDGRFDLEGHRGARGLVPENTIPSFLSAVESGCTGVELDVRLTADGEVVVWHDPTLQADKCTFRDADLTGRRVDELTLAQLRTVDVGSLTLGDFPEQTAVPGTGISTLAELVAAVDDSSVGDGGLWWTIELKVDPTDAREAATRVDLLDGVVSVVRQAGIERRCFVHSFDWTVLELSAERAPELLRSALFVPMSDLEQMRPWSGSIDLEQFHGDLPGAVAELGAVVVSPWHGVVDAALVQRSHELGLSVLPWTVNEQVDLLRCRHAGVDGLVTDYPDRARTVLAL